MAVDVTMLEHHARAILMAIGEDINRPGLAETPARYARMWRDFIDYEPGSTNTSFESVHADQMVVVSGMKVWSFCEHHLLPFWADISCGYLTDQKVLGLSKFARIAHKHAHRLQVQEQLVEQIADEITDHTGTPNVAVLAQGVHTCMVMRGIKTEGIMTSSAMRGTFREDPKAREEFLRILHL